MGDPTEATLLDAGTGNGWLFDHVRPKQAHACDLVQPAHLPSFVEFRQEDVNQLSYPEGMFDIIVGSLLVIYCKDLLGVCRELHRIAKPDGAKLVLSIMHPYFYRTGEVMADGTFVVTRDLSRPTSLPLHIAKSVGPFEYFYRPLPEYLNALIRAKWRISEVTDWFVDMNKYSSERLEGRVRRTGSVPLFSFLECCSS